MGLGNFVDYVQEKTTDPELVEILVLAQDQVRRIGRIVERVLRYGRGGDGAIRSIDLERLVADARLLLKSQINRAAIDLEVRASEPAPQVVGDKDVLDQSVVNLSGLLAILPQAANQGASTPSSAPCPHGSRVWVRTAKEGSRRRRQQRRDDKLCNLRPG